MKRVCLLGSTGSVGRSSLAVMARHPDRFAVVGISAHDNAVGLARQAARLDSPAVVLSGPDRGSGVDERWGRGRDALVELARSEEADLVINAVVGAAGLEPTLAALEAGRTVALANKESLVAGGELVLAAARRGGGAIIPIDSEHSAIWQCLDGRCTDGLASVTLTASGGAFRGRDPKTVADATVDQALDHPTWRMGAKITVDSATLANKALEVIEAHFLYELPYDSLRAVLHPQSIVHSFVEFVDGSVLAQLGFPNMEQPILYALGFPVRVPDRTLRNFDPVAASPLVFEEIDDARHPLYRLGRTAGEAGGSAPTAFNAANEIAVNAFLRGELRFGEIAEVVCAAWDEVGTHSTDSVEDVAAADGEARRAAKKRIKRLRRAGGS